MAEKTALELRIEKKAGLYNEMKQGGLTANPLKEMIANAKTPIIGVGDATVSFLTIALNAVTPVVVPPAVAEPVPDFPLWYAEKATFDELSASVAAKETSILEQLASFSHYAEVNSGVVKPTPDVKGEPAGLTIICSVINGLTGFYSSIGEKSTIDYSTLLLGSLTDGKPEIKTQLATLAAVKLKADIVAYTIENTAASVAGFKTLLNNFLAISVDFETAMSQEKAEFIKAQQLLQDNLTLEVAMSGNPTFEAFRK